MACLVQDYVGLRGIFALTCGVLTLPVFGLLAFSYVPPLVSTIWLGVTYSFAAVSFLTMNVWHPFLSVRSYLNLMFLLLFLLNSCWHNKRVEITLVSGHIWMMSTLTKKIKLGFSGRDQTSGKVNIPVIQVLRSRLVHIYLCRNKKQHFFLLASVALPTSMTN